ncbi:hypothetical protein [Halodesulfovibrio aestuarii]|uniref:Uncharacterized protein n=1 Tax=Halodesulfovibrio aestuarii TaxID=126333 RepID=A0ABV4JX27_9BACT
MTFTDRRLKEQFTTAYYDAMLEYLRIYKAAIITGNEPPSMPQFVVESEIWGEVFATTPPEVNVLRPLLFQLPPIVKRTELGSGALNFVSKAGVSVDDSRGAGPRVRFKIGQSVCYPVGYLLEYLEAKPRMRVIVKQNLGLVA